MRRAASAAISGVSGGDAGDDLGLEPHHVLREQRPVLREPAEPDVGEVVLRHDRQHAGQGLGRRRVDRQDLRVRVVGVAELRGRHAGHRHVGGVAAGAGDLLDAVGADVAWSRVPRCPSPSQVLPRMVMRSAHHPGSGRGSATFASAHRASGSYRAWGRPRWLSNRTRCSTRQRDGVDLGRRPSPRARAIGGRARATVRCGVNARASGGRRVGQPRLEAGGEWPPTRPRDRRGRPTTRGPSRPAGTDRARSAPGRTVASPPRSRAPPSVTGPTSSGADQPEEPDGDVAVRPRDPARRRERRRATASIAASTASCAASGDLDGHEQAPTGRLLPRHGLRPWSRRPGAGRPGGTGGRGRARPARPTGARARGRRG